MRESKKNKIKLCDWLLRVFYPRIQRSESKVSQLAIKNFKSIVIYSTTALGDYMFNSPAVRAIRHRYPDAHITLIAHEKYKSLLSTRSLYDDVLFWDNKVSSIFSVSKQARKWKPELAVLLHSHLPYDIASAAMAGCEYIVRDNYSKDIGPMDRHLVYGLGDFDEHIIARKMKLVSVLGCDTGNINMELPCAWTPLEKKEGMIRIGFQMGASSRDRCWPVEHYAELAARLTEKSSDIEIVLIGSAAERYLEDELRYQLESTVSERVISFIGKTNFPELLSVIASMDLLITGDTGPLHLAVALKTPTLSLFVTANPRYTGPYQDPDIHQNIFLPQTAQQLSEDEYPLRVISVESVFSTAKNMIDKSI